MHIINKIHHITIKLFMFEILFDKNEINLENCFESKLNIWNKKMEFDFELIAILLVSHGSSGPRLLFKYPFSHENNETNLKIPSICYIYIINLGRIFFQYTLNY